MLQVGDLVKIRQWEDMASEYEVDCDGCIYLEKDEIFFTPSMKLLCGKVFRVSGFLKDDGFFFLEGCSEKDRFEPSAYIFSEEMIEFSMSESHYPIENLPKTKVSFDELLK